MTVQRVTILIVSLLLACFVLVACTAVLSFLFLGLMGPAIGNVYSNIVVLTPTP